MNIGKSQSNIGLGKVLNICIANETQQIHLHAMYGIMISNYMRIASSETINANYLPYTAIFNQSPNAQKQLNSKTCNTIFLNQMTKMV